jgi:arabinofuranosyltransferase
VTAEAGPTGGIRPALLLALVVAVAVAHAAFYDFPFEDAFITYRYAENLCRGVGLAYNAGEVVEGFTSFGWTLILAAVSWVGLPIVAVSRALSLACGLGALGMTWTLARRWMQRKDAWTVAPVLLVAAHGTWAYYAATGMETMLFVLLVLVGAALATDAGTRKHAAPLMGLALAAAALVRPEGAGYFGALAAALLVDRQDRRLVGGAAASFGVVFVPYFAWRWHHFGWLLPNTYYAKASFSASIALRGAEQLECFTTMHLFWLLPPALVLLVRRQGWTRGWRIASALVAAAAVNMVVVGGDAFAFYRFLLPAIAAGSILLAGAAATLAESRTGSARQALGVAVVLFAVLTFVAELRPIASLTTRRGKSWRQYVTEVAAIDDGYFAVGRWLRATFPPEATLATNAAGIVPYVSGLRTIDMLGLNDAHIAHAPIVLGHGPPGHEKHDGRYVLSRRPDVVLVGLPVLQDEPVGTGGIQAAVAKWFPYFPGDEELVNAPGFREAYVPISTRVEEGRWLLVFVRQSDPLTRGAGLGDGL